MRLDLDILNLVGHALRYLICKAGTQEASRYWKCKTHKYLKGVMRQRYSAKLDSKGET